MAIYIYNGLPGSGKTTKLASIGLSKLKRNKKLYIGLVKNYLKEQGVEVADLKGFDLSKPLPANWVVPDLPKRLLVSNIKFSSDVESEYEGFIDYWSDPAELVKKRDVDILWDEVATYLDSTQWANVPLELKRFLQLHRHYGIEIWGTTQDFGMVDISMRRLVKGAYLVRKVIGSRDKSATLPPVKNPWGMIWIREIDQSSVNDKREDYKLELIPEFLFITKRLTSAFDTTQELKPGKYPPLRHVIRFCNEPGCNHSRVTHI